MLPGFVNPNDLPSSNPVSISPNGMYICGSGFTPDNGSGAIYWDSDLNIHVVPSNLAIGLGMDSANAISNDGRVIVGHGGVFTNYYGWVYTPETGAVFLDDYLASHGVMFPAGWRSWQATSLSADGTVIGGMAVGPNNQLQGFIATVPAPGTVFLLCLAAARRRRA